MAAIYLKKNCVILTLALGVFGLMTACLTSPWFYLSGSFTLKLYNAPAASGVTSFITAVLNSTSVYYDLVGTRTSSRVSGSITNQMQTCTRSQNNHSAYLESYEYLESASNPSIFSIFKLSQACVIIASISSLALSVKSVLFLLDTIRNKVIVTLGIPVTRSVQIVLGLLLVASVAISFLGFLGVSAAFEKDQTDCSDGHCRSFSGSATSHQNSGTVYWESSWGPGAGWYMALAATPLSLLVIYLEVTNHFPPHTDADVSSGEHDMQQMLESSTASQNLTEDSPPASKSHSLSSFDRRARIALVVAASCCGLAFATIIWASSRPHCTTCTTNAPQLAEADGLEGVPESIEMQVLPPPPVSWPSLQYGRQFYERVLSSLTAKGMAGKGDLGFEFDAKATKERNVARQIWQLPSCLSGNCSTIVPLPLALVRYRQVVSGSSNGSSDFTLKQTRRFRQVAATLPQCTTAANVAACNAKIEANYYWRGTDTYDVGVTWQRSCTLQLQPASRSSPSPLPPSPASPVIGSVRDVLPFFPSALAAFGPDSLDTLMFQRDDCYHEREYKASARYCRDSVVT